MVIESIMALIEDDEFLEDTLVEDEETESEGIEEIVGHIEVAQETEIGEEITYEPMPVDVHQPTYDHEEFYEDEMRYESGYTNHQAVEGEDENFWFADGMMTNDAVEKIEEAKKKFDLGLGAGDAYLPIEGTAFGDIPIEVKDHYDLIKHFSFNVLFLYAKYEMVMK